MKPIREPGRRGGISGETKAQWRRAVKTAKAYGRTTSVRAEIATARPAAFVTSTPTPRLVTPDPALARQASRLRFTDPAQEHRFRADHDERSLRQWRLAACLGALAVTAIGVFYNANNFAMSRVETIGRFALVLPWFLFALVFTFWRAQRSRLQLVGALCCTGAVSLYFVTECFAMSANIRLTYSLVVSLFSLNNQFLVAVAVTVPLHTRAAATMLLTSTACSYFAMRAAYPIVAQNPHLHNAVLEQVATGTLIALVLIAVLWARERLQRLTFAQQEQLAEKNAELARLNAEKNEFMAIAAHDLRAPLAAVGLAAEQLAPRASDPTLAKGLALIGEQTRRMLGLVSDYLGAHTAESGTLPVRLARLDLSTVAREAAARHATSAAAKKQPIELGGADAHVAVEADPALLAQIADNFVTNALKFSPPGSPVRLEIQTADGHPRARLAVIDQGPGLTSEEQGRLFRKFSRTNARPTAGESSHGLGLAVAKRLAEAMGGTVGCDSQPGHGATFWVELPRVG